MNTGLTQQPSFGVIVERCARENIVLAFIDPALAELLGLVDGGWA
jgi:hypothetical protein